MEDLVEGGYLARGHGRRTVAGASITPALVFTHSFARRNGAKPSSRLTEHFTPPPPAWARDNTQALRQSAGSMSAPHDALFRATFSNPENAAAELRRVLSPALVAMIEFSSLTVLSGHFVDDELQTSESDMLFSAKVDGADTLIYALVEHQSSVDWGMPFRLLRYMANAWEQYLKEHVGARNVPPIVPVVLHHSPGGWTAATSLGELLDVPDALRVQLAAHTPDFRFVLHDLAREDLAALRQSAVPDQLKFVLFLLQRTRDNPMLDQELGEWVGVAQNLNEDALRAVMSYIALVSEIDPAPVEQWAQRVGKKAEEAYVTTAEKIAQQARAKALIEGRSMGRQEGRLDGRRELLKTLLKRRFGELPAAAEQRLSAASERELDDWAIRVLDVGSIDDLFQV